VGVIPLGYPAREETCREVTRLALTHPAWVVLVRAGEALGFRRLGRRRCGALLRAVSSTVQCEIVGLAAPIQCEERSPSTRRPAPTALRPRPARSPPPPCRSRSFTTMAGGLSGPSIHFCAAGSRIGSLSHSGQTRPLPPSTVSSYTSFIGRSQRGRAFLVRCSNHICFPHAAFSLSPIGLCTKRRSDA